MLRNAGDDIEQFIFQENIPYKESWLWELMMAGKKGFAWLQKNSLLDKKTGMLAWIFDMDVSIRHFI